MNKKRLLLITLFLLISIGLGYAVYRVFFAAPTAEEITPTTKNQQNGGKFPEAEQGGVTKETTQPSTELPVAGTVAPTITSIPATPTAHETIVTQNSVVSPTVDQNGRMQYYDASQGKFFRIGADGKPQALSDQVFYDAQNVTWSPTKSETIIQYPDGSNIYYNFDTNKQVTLPKHWEDFSFAPQGDQIEAKSIGLDPKNRWLVTSDPTGANVKTVEALGDNASKVIMGWSPTNQVIALSRTGEPLEGDRQQILLIGQNHENFQALTVEGRDMRTKWSPSGKNLLYSIYNSGNEMKPQLWITGAEVDKVDAGRRPINVTTWADKCVFADEKYIYCGVPTELDVGAGLEPRIADSTPDKLYKIDVQTGLKTEITMDDTHTIGSISVGENGKALFITDKNKSGLFRIGL